jgi:MFS superfamily sulfate permease-like transporter
LTLAALGIPEVMGYTKIIGTPIVTGLYTLLLPVIAFAIFGSSRHLVVSADSATAAMVAAALTALAFTSNTAAWVELTSLIAIVAAAILLLARILRLGFLSDFLSRTVLVGFLSGVGVQVAAGQLHEMLGIDKGGHGFFRQMLFLGTHVGHTHVPTLLVAVAVLAIIVVLERVAPRFPGALLAVIAMTAASAFFHWSDRGIHVIGAVPSGLPHVGLPHLRYHEMVTVLPIALSCFIVILAQSAATSRAYALKYHEPLNQNADLVGLSFANVAAACTGTFVVNGSPTKTAIVDGAGGRTQWSHVTTAVVVLMVVLFLTRPLGFLPTGVLASIVFLIGVKLVDVRGLTKIGRVAPREFALAIITAGTVIVFGVEQGIILAVVLSLLQHVRHSYRPPTAVMLKEGSQWELVEDAPPGTMTAPGLVIYWFGADLFYANSAFFASQAHALVHHSSTPVRWFVIDASAITDIDYSAAQGLIELHAELAKAGVELGLITVKVRHRGKLEQLGLVQLIGPERMFQSRDECLATYTEMDDSRAHMTPAGHRHSVVEHLPFEH